MVKAGAATDDTIAQLVPLLEKGDILIDGGDSYFVDTQRRTKELEPQGIHFIGSGVSGGEQGALEGPAIMSGGTKEAYAHVELYLTVISAKVDGDPCCSYIGPDGAGHYVKMVHNGIEYGDMQIICEAYHLLKEVIGEEPEELHHIFKKWNEGELNSYLIICSYAQRFAQLKMASDTYGWGLNCGNIAMLFRGGCIIRAQFLDNIKDAFEKYAGLTNLLLDDYFRNIVNEYQQAWREVVAAATLNGVTIPAFASALSYFDAYRTEYLPANLLQAQRDYFGAHTFERVDKEGSFHFQWSN